jgi:hypothetical protein
MASSDCLGGLSSYSDSQGAYQFLGFLLRIL